MSESIESNSKPAERRAAEERLRELLKQATDPDRKLAEALLVQRRTAFGIAVICLSPFVILVAILFHEMHPDITPIVLLMALSLLIAGALQVERVNIARRKLATKILRRLGKLHQSE